MQQKLENCNLITGQDKEFRVSNLTSCTIEALNTSDEYDVAIIDEIQMIGDYERGWSWTKALISTKAKRIHLCGDERAIGLVSKLIKDCGGTLEERRYSRLGKLKLIPKIFEMKNIEEGDCLI
jgi:ATP-dependent RNA helicase SUPV3L1/SUV3